jgi:hypothetical protein
VPTPIAAARPELWLQTDGPALASDEVASQSG